MRGQQPLSILEWHGAAGLTNSSWFAWTVLDLVLKVLSPWKTRTGGHCRCHVLPPLPCLGPLSFPIPSPFAGSLAQPFSSALLAST